MNRQGAQFNFREPKPTIKRPKSILMIHKSTLEKLSSTCKLLNTITKRAKSTVIKLRVTFKMTK